MRIVSPKTVAINDTRLGVTLTYLGYPVEFKPTIHDRTREKHVQFLFDQQSVRFPALPALDQLLEQWRSGKITDQHHLMNVCARAHRNFDAIIRWQKEFQQQRLRLDDSGRAYTYHAGAPLAPPGPLKFTEHLDLAAALGEIGFQIHDIRGQGRDHTYGLPSFAMPVNDSNGKLMRYQLADVERLEPTKEDERRLALEVEQPMHPLPFAYNLLRCRGVVKKQIDALASNLLIEVGTRQALIHINASGHVMDHVTAHFKAPPLP